MAMARLNRPSLFVYGGAILPGNYKGNDINIQDMYEAVGTYSQGDISLDELDKQEIMAEGTASVFELEEYRMNHSDKLQRGEYA